MWSTTWRESTFPPNSDHLSRIPTGPPGLHRPLAVAVQHHLLGEGPAEHDLRVYSYSTSSPRLRRSCSPLAANRAEAVTITAAMSSFGSELVNPWPRV